MREHWKAQDGEIVFDGKGVSLCTRKDYRDFRLDRIRQLSILPEHFNDKPHPTLADYISDLARDREPGHDVDDWLQAERELRNATRFIVA